MRFTKSTTVAQILKHPKGRKILAKYHLPCLHCPMAAYEVGKLKIGEVARMYRINIQGLLTELNYSPETQE
ncbi:MAG TPA: hypothetical protein ENG47_05470 [Candidatus Aerophobetes bacterium]|uniref:DUF1858 domain-containing protein n=1 Tax=Aerophobetes bacterium TaxID=2030807 RepID=A0A662DH08_UNCAE|nr:MAG: hypothetical protein DRI96_02770 [Candidatus Aerophobetes bacterium]HDN85183.1 hypothetical protein [Candidatus Aerophobetes bacterium]